MTNTRDYIVRATAANSQIRAFAIQSKNLVEKARQVHHTSPVATAALGRLLSGAAMMGSMMKGENDILTLQMKGDGPIQGITVTADSHANVKGYVGNPNVIIGPNYAGKLDVGAAIGYGTLSVSKDLGLKEPYNSQIPLTTSEVAEDLTYYFAKSEQVPSAVGLGVLMSKENTVEQAGGFIIQLMPFAEESVIDILEKKVEEIKNECCPDLKKGEICCIKVLGAGCKSCHEQYENVKQAVKDMRLSVEVEYITDMQKVMEYGVMSMPALVVNGAVRQMP